jgi:hypothetical protein
LTRRTRYLAYGSNLCAEQMARRCPAAEAGEVVELPDWRFTVNRRGVATLLPEPGARTWALVWQLTPACEAALDRYEGVAAGIYRREMLRVPGGAPALVYLASETAPGLPRPGYLEGILRAAELRGLPLAYRTELAGWCQPATAPRDARGTCP